MKKYSTTIAARKLVTKSIAFGTSRHLAKHQNQRKICGYGTARTHRSALKICADWLHLQDSKHLKNMNATDAAEYLTLRALTVNQKTLDLDRQVLNFHLLHEDPIPFVVSNIQQKLVNRAYTPAQIDLLLAQANPKMRLSILAAVNAGLRAMELITVAPAEMLKESERKGWSRSRFIGREQDIVFVVHGKGGLCRQVRLSPQLAAEMWASARLGEADVVDREVNLKSYFDLTGGVNFSSQFSKLSKKVLGMSHGAHGLRHTFAKARLHNLMCLGLSFEEALRVLSNELGHFATSNTFAYLRD